ncbi:mannitol dehydrogenase family protein [Seongchinamella unica]|uniref:Mannitol dehydrogenase family protein n=1 Tax=Seongchinamella unica TaxID=2547392 RepID=A0A4R5LT37_9GAMM|nr:mannitol dehydrogenase family protein [Seongchinamella unica]TDG14102.1 mannitol dehydrogenase family protein [Seongchinamella unica]
MSERLSQRSLPQVNAGVRAPTYDWQRLEPGIVHLGLGAFHRAHQAVFTEDAILHSGGNWGITGVSMRSDSVARQLLPQDCLYSVLAEDGREQSLRVVAVVRNVLVAATQLEAVCQAIASPRTRIVSLTITEKGYCTGADGCSLDRDHVQLRSDLDNPQQPTSAIGVLALALERRRLQGGQPLTLISCDNLSANGRVLAAVLREYAGLVFPELSGWLEEHTRYPCSMVDRIVPAAAARQQAAQSAMLGLDDKAAIATERFNQWIIEDDFCSERPAWDAVGVQFVDNILPYERIKLGLVNATHSAIAYAGLLAGRETVDEVVSDPTLGGYVHRLMTRSLVPALSVPAGFDLNSYVEQLWVRFSNPCLRHRCAQIAMDGSEKISQRWLPVLQQATRPEELLKALACWCYYVLDSALDISDPRADQLLALRASGDPTRLQGVLAYARITAESVPGYPQLCEQLEQNINRIRREGVRAFLAE